MRQERRKRKEKSKFKGFQLESFIGLNLETVAPTPPEPKNLGVSLFTFHFSPFTALTAPRGVS
jgi:hypothetical protein